MIKITSVEAQNKFGQLLDTVQREPDTITRHGRVVALMVRPEDFEAHMKNTLHQQESKKLSGMQAIANFRGAGKIGSVSQFLQDRKSDRQTELAKERPSKNKRGN
jgi:prevent-host-death family protein